MYAASKAAAESVVRTMADQDVTQDLVSQALAAALTGVDIEGAKLAALETAFKTAARDFEKSPLRLIAAALGPVATNMLTATSDKFLEEMLEKMDDNVAMSTKAIAKDLRQMVVAGKSGMTYQRYGGLITPEVTRHIRGMDELYA